MYNTLGGGILKKLIVLLFGVIAIQFSALNPAHADYEYYNTYTNYTVVEGDTLKTIANKYKLGVDDILSSNSELATTSVLEKVNNL